MISAEWHQFFLGMAITIRKCKCLYKRALTVFGEQVKAYPSKSLNQRAGMDCFEMSSTLGQLFEAALINEGYFFSVSRGGKFTTRARALPSDDNSPIIWVRFVRLHSVLRFEGKDKCKEVVKDVKAFDFLEQSVYNHNTFLKEYSLGVNGANAGYYRVEDPPRSDILLPGQGDPVLKTPGGIDIEGLL